MAELCAALYTSHSSIRRDLAYLEEKGLVSRHYSGVELKRYCSIVPFAARSHHNISAKKIMAAKALSEKGRIYDCNRSEVCIRQTMLDNAAKKVFLCGSEKFFKTAGYLQCDLSVVDAIVSEKSVPMLYTKKFKNLQIIKK